MTQARLPSLALPQGSPLGLQLHKTHRFGENYSSMEQWKTVLLLQLVDYFWGALSQETQTFSLYGIFTVSEMKTQGCFTAGIHPMIPDTCSNNLCMIWW